jgi:hypothetical protein
VTAGDRIWFRQTCRGGYGFQRDVPGWFVRQTAKRVTVLLSIANSERKVTVPVHPKNVRARETGR